MQILSEVVGLALQKGVVQPRDLYSTEGEVIDKFLDDSEVAQAWQKFRELCEITRDEATPLSLRRSIFAKKRYIDPYIKGVGRLSEQNSPFKQDLYDYIQSSQDYWIAGI